MYVHMYVWFKQLMNELLVWLMVFSKINGTFTLQRDRHSGKMGTEPLGNVRWCRRRRLCSLNTSTQLKIRDFIGHTCFFLFFFTIQIKLA